MRHAEVLRNYYGTTDQLIELNGSSRPRVVYRSLPYIEHAVALSGCFGHDRQSASESEVWTSFFIRPKSRFIRDSECEGTHRNVNMCKKIVVDKSRLKDKTLALLNMVGIICLG